MNPSKPTPPGAFYREGRTTFRVWAPLKDNMTLLLEKPGSPGSTGFPMTRTSGGYWEYEGQIAAGSRYRYSSGGEPPVPDPASRFQPTGVHGPSEVTDPGMFNWKDQQWKGRPFREFIISEIHTGTFSYQHNFSGICGRLDYLRNAGINAIELMPVNQFPGTRNWGYDGVFPFAVQNSYGGPDELKNLVNEAHSKGIAVILDVVYNHLGPEGNYLGAFGPYFTDKYKLFWGASINLDDAWSDGVREYFISNALMWLDEFHIDGLRLDAVHALKDSGAAHFIADLQRAVTKLETEKGLPKHLIAEIDLNDARYLESEAKGGYGLRGQWVDEFHHSLHSLLTGEKAGYYEDFGDTDQLVKAFENTYVYDGNYSLHRKRRFGSDATGFDFDRFVVFSQNHDQTGNRLNGDRLSTLVPFEGLKLAAAVVMLSPYIPLLFMGEEYGEKNPFLFFVDHSDPALLEAVRKGRKEEFAYFKHSGEFPDPASENSFIRSELSWDYSQPEPAALLRWYAWLAAQRTERAALKDIQRLNLHVRKLDDKIIYLERKGGDDAIFVLFNFNKEGVSVVSPAKQDLVFVTSSAGKEWAGPDEQSGAQTWKAGTTILIPALAALIFNAG